MTDDTTFTLQEQLIDIERRFFREMARLNYDFRREIDDVLKADYAVRPETWEYVDTWSHDAIEDFYKRKGYDWPENYHHIHFYKDDGVETWVELYRKAVQS